MNRSILARKSALDERKTSALGDCWEITPMFRDCGKNSSFDLNNLVIISSAIIATCQLPSDFVIPVADVVFAAIAV